jgi:hypothetical protein
MISASASVRVHGVRDAEGILGMVRNPDSVRTVFGAAIEHLSNPPQALPPKVAVDGAMTAASRRLLRAHSWT